MFNKATVHKISRMATQQGVEPAAMLAVADVESAGVALWNVRGEMLPPIRFEGHYFFKLLSGAKRKAAVRAGLASPKAGGVKNPGSYQARYALLERARDVDEAAAYMSTSWGLGQVMGDHWKKLGYPSVQAMVKTAKSGVDGQVEIMARYIKKFGLADELQRQDWHRFALAYNGPAYKKNRYAEKMAAAYNLYSKHEKGWVDDKDVPVTGDSPVKVIQRDLKRLGYYKGSVDGVAGAKTVQAIKAFQREYGLVADGKYGKMTDEAVDREINKLNRKSADNTVGAGATATGTGAMAEVVNEQVSHLETFAYYSDIITYIVLGLVVIGMGLTVWGLWKKYKASQEQEN